MNSNGEETTTLWKADPADKNKVRVGPGVTEVDQPQSRLELQAEEIARVGYTVVEDCFTPEEVAYISEKIDHYYKLQVEEIGGEDKLRAIGDELSVKHLIAYDDIFLKVASVSDVEGLFFKCINYRIRY